MADPNVYFKASYDGIPLLIAEISTDRGNDVVTQSPSVGDQHSRSNRGLGPNDTTVSIIFCDQPGQAPYLVRYDAFIKAAESSEPKVFSHPLDGSYRARVGRIQVSASADALAVKISCPIYRVDAPQTVFPVSAGTTASAGVESVTVAAGALDDELDDIEVPDGFEAPTADCVEKVTAWDEADELDSQQVFSDVAALTQSIDDMIAELELTSDLDRWQAYRAAIMLRYAVVQAAEAFTADADQIVDVVVDTPQPLRMICVELVGAEDAEDLATKVAKTNRIRNPGRIPAGTTLKVPMARRAA